LQFKASLGKKFVSPHLNKEGSGYQGSIGERIAIQAGPDKNARPYTKSK
jgi:hypothetical protein